MKKIKLLDKIKLPDVKIPTIPSLSAVPSLISGLNRRERFAIYGAGVALVIFLILQLIIFPVFTIRSRLKSEIISKRAALQEMYELKSEFDILTQSNRIADSDFKKRAKSFTLFSFLDNLAGKSGIKQNIGYMKPSTSNLKNSPYVLSIVEMKLQSITMEQMVTFLHGIEMSGEQLWVKRMSLSRDDKKEGLLNSIIQVETYQL